MEELSRGRCEHGGRDVIHHAYILRPDQPKQAREQHGVALFLATDGVVNYELSVVTDGAKGGGEELMVVL